MSDYQTLDRQASSLENNAINSAAAANTLPAKLREAVAMRFQNSPLIGQREEAMKTFLSEPDDTRAYLADKVKSGVILSPTQQSQIASGRSVNASIPLVSLNDLLARESGGIDKIVEAGTGAFNAKVIADQGAAQLARKRADTAFDRFVQLAELNMKQADSAAKSNVTDNSTLAWVEQLQNGTAKINQIPAEERNKVVQLLSENGINITDLQKQLKGKTIQGVLSGLQELYNGIPDKSGKKQSLAKGRLGGTLANFLGSIGANSQAKTYNQNADALLASLKEITGDTGILTDPDAIRIRSLLPKTTDNAEEAKLAWESIDKLLRNKYGVSILEDPDFIPDN